MNIEYIALNSIKHNKSEFVKINFSHKYKYEFDNNNLEQFEKSFNTEGFFGGNISSLIGVIGENGSGKTRLISDLILLLEEPNDATFDFILIVKNNNKFYYISNIELLKSSFSIEKLNENLKSIFLKALYSKVVDANTSYLDGKHILDLTSNSEVFNEKLNQTNMKHKNAYNQIKLVSEYHDLLIIDDDEYVKIPDSINIYSNLEVLENNDFTELVGKSLLIDYQFKNKEFGDTKLLKNDSVTEKYKDFIRIPFGLLNESYFRAIMNEFEVRYKEDNESIYFKHNQILKDIFDSLCKKVFINVLSFLPKKFEIAKRGFHKFVLYEKENLIIDIEGFGKNLSDAFYNLEYLSSIFYFNIEEIPQDNYDLDSEDGQRELYETIIPKLKSMYKEYYLNQLRFEKNNHHESIVKFKWEKNLSEFFNHVKYMLLNILEKNLYVISDFTELYHKTLYRDHYDVFCTESFNDHYLDEIEDVNQSEIQEYQIKNLIERLNLELKNFIKEQFSFIDSQMKIIGELIEKSSTSNENSFVDVEIPVYSEELKTYLQSVGDDYKESLLLFSWRNMSSGEIAILNLLSKIKEIKDETKKRKLAVKESYNLNNKMEEIPYKDVVLFVDEGDLYLHPQWQKKFLEIFLKATERILGDTRLHIILTTHSPFIVSDIPPENILLLRNSVGNNNYFSEGTFGANINELLANNFFIQGGLVGEFAKSKINNTVNELLEANDEGSLERIFLNREYYESFIDIIAEPIVKLNVKEILNSKIMEYELQLDPLIEEIQKKEAELNILKSRLEESKNEKTNN